MAVTANDQVDRLARSVQLCCKGLITIDRDSIAITAICITKVAEHDEYIRLGFHLIIVMQDRIRRILETNTGSGGGNCDGRRFGGCHTDECDLDGRRSDCQDLIRSVR